MCAKLLYELHKVTARELQHQLAVAVWEHLGGWRNEVVLKKPCGSLLRTETGEKLVWVLSDPTEAHESIPVEFRMGLQVDRTQCMKAYDLNESQFQELLEAMKWAANELVRVSNKEMEAVKAGYLRLVFSGFKVIV